MTQTSTKILVLHYIFEVRLPIYLHCGKTGSNKAFWNHSNTHTLYIILFILLYQICSTRLSIQYWIEILKAELQKREVQIKFKFSKQKIWKYGCSLRDNQMWPQDPQYQITMFGATPVQPPTPPTHTQNISKALVVLLFLIQNKYKCCYFYLIC